MLSVVPKSVCFVVAQDLHSFADGCSDECAFDRLMMIDGRACHRADDRAARLAVVMTMVAVMVRLREGAAGGQKERDAQQCRLDFLRCHGCTSDVEYCEIGAGKLNN
jgi:hypothetical protein